MHSVSIRTKLSILATITSVVAITVAGIGLGIQDYRSMRDARAEQIDAHLQMLVWDSGSDIANQRPTELTEKLSSLILRSDVDFASIQSLDGQTLAIYQSHPQVIAPTTPYSESGRQFHGSTVEINRPVWNQGERIGSIYTRAKLTELNAHLFHYVFSATGILLAAFIVSCCTSSWLRRSIYLPLEKIIDAMGTIESRQNYHQRLPTETSLELAGLTNAINSLLNEVQSSKSTLVANHRDLEEHVAQRTNQLTAEIEQQKSMQGELETARDAAEEANLAKSEFLANMSHEIRTPLNGILGFAELLANNADGNDLSLRQDYLSTITTSGRHLLSLINDILDLSKIEAGQLDLELSSCSPHEIISQVASVLRVKARQKGLSLECNWKTRVPDSIVTDGGRLRQLLMNLVGNAIKFTDTGYVRIDANLDEYRELLTVSVSDSGIGIPANKHKAIFDPFVQADNSVTRRFGGTGLGLAICQRISRTLGGDLSVDSTPDQGSTFTFRIQTGPLDHVNLLDAPEADALKSHECVQEEADLNLEGIRVLLVEDGDINRKLVKLMLQGAGATVDTAENGWAGLQLSKRNTFDLIVMDMQMPVMDGYTAARKMREDGLVTPILALTAHAMKGDERKCLEAGCTVYLTKPVQRSQLLETIRQYTDGKSAISTNTMTDVPTPGEWKNPLRSTLPLEQPIYREIVEEFVEFLGGHVAEMRSAFISGDRESLAQLAHGLKGAGGTAGFNVLTEPAAQLQDSATDQLDDDIEMALSKLEKLSERIRETPQRV